MASDAGLAAILWENDNPRRVPLNIVAEEPDNPLLVAAVRAVGAANGRNPLSIIAPCHRVLGSDGQLTGFAGGLPAKAHLLALESAWHAPNSNLSTRCSVR